jgi:hypothetical protein
LTRDLQPVDSVGERRHLQRVSANYTAITDLAAHAGKIYLFSCGDAASVRYDPASDDTERLPLPGKGVGRMAEEYAVWQADHGRGAWNVSSIVAQAASAGGHLFLLSVRAHEVGWQGVARDLVIAEVDTAFQPLRLWHITLRPQKQTVFLQIFIRDFAVALIEGKTLFFLSVYRGYQDLEVDDWREYRSLHVLRPVDQSSASVNSQPQ